MRWFGVPGVLVLDNGRQFDNTPFKYFWKKLGIKNHCSMGLQVDCEYLHTVETPFKLAYGSETIIPTEVHMANHKVMKY